jgi:hypothetical protein
MLIVQNNLLNSPGALLHSTFRNRLKTRPASPVLRKMELFRVLPMFFGK